jgi:hypothetical protein
VTLLRREHHERRRVPFVAIEADSAKADGERYRQIVATVARHADVVVDAQAKGALSRQEAMLALRRQAQDLLTAIALLDERSRT